MGRYAYSSRRIAEYSFKVDIADLAETFRGPCMATSSGTIRQTRGEWSEDIAAFTFTVTMGPKVSETAGDLGGLIIPTGDSFIQFEHDYQGQHYSGKHYIDRRPVNLGGYRYFFRCGHCGQRVTALYFGGKAWACRSCCDLVYQKSRDSRSLWTGQHTAEIMRKKAKALRSQKHPRLANRLEWKAYELEEQFQRAFDRAVLRRFGIL